MNYIWDAIIKAKREKINTDDIVYKLPEVYSPYLEIAMNYINYQIDDECTELEVNPFYRFNSIFKSMYKPGDEDYLEVKQELLNCILHYISKIDIYTGMNSHEFMRMYINRDIENGYYGVDLQENWQIFDLEEQETIVTQLINMYKTGSSIEIARKAILGVFHDGYIYYNKVLKDEILIFAGIKERDKYKKKMDILINLFMPLDFKYKIYWSKHFGIIGNDELMVEDAMVLY